MASTAPRYEAQGWVHWPTHPEWSAQFSRILGSAQDGASTISECFQAASRMRAGDADSWHAEWCRLAQSNAMRAAEATPAGALRTAQANHLRASNYHRVSELFLAPGDPRRQSIFASCVAASGAHLRLMVPPGESVAIALSDGNSGSGGDVLDAYFIKPRGAVPHPVVIAFGGLDGCKDELVQRMARAATERGLALLLVDLPGQGKALRERNMANRTDTEVPVAACVDYLLQRDDVDSDAIALYGASLGGVYAGRAASAEHRLKAVVSDGIIFDLHASLQSRLAHGEAEGWALLQWVFGCDTPAGVVEKSRRLIMAEFMARIRCPYLIVQGEHDFLGLQTALDAFEHATRCGVDVELRIFTGEETGASHCQADNPALGMEFICDWLARKLIAA